MSLVVAGGIHDLDLVGIKLGSYLGHNSQLVTDPVVYARVSSHLRIATVWFCQNALGDGVCEKEAKAEKVELENLRL